MKTLVFDVYGTLINTYGMVDLLQRLVGEDLAMPFATRWRDKQLEYSFRRSLMGQYEPYTLCTIDALDYCIEAFSVTLNRDQRYSLIKRYENLPVFKDVVPAMEQLAAVEDVQLYALTNGTREAVHKIFEDNAIDHYFSDIISADDVRKYKPDPEVYRYFMSKTGVDQQNYWHVSGNSFDLIGAAAAGAHSLWLKRNNRQFFDPWGNKPDHCISSLSELVDLVKQ